MRLTSIRNPEAWERRIAILRKQLSTIYLRRCDTKPIFVMGMQRSGTSMLMRAFHRNPYTFVIDEHKSNAAFQDYCLRDLSKIDTLISKSRFPYLCFKPICDSHRLNELHDHFKDAHFVWLYRDFQDVANSYIRKFESSTRAIRLVCNDQPGGGWFSEGISTEMLKTLKGLYRRSLSDFDLSCLVWWARNRVILDSGLIGSANLTILRYETLVSDPVVMLQWLFKRAGINYTHRVAHKISTRSIHKNIAPEIDQEVLLLCRSMAESLDRLFYSQDPLLVKKS